MKIDDIEIDELWFFNTDTNEILKSVLYFVVDNPLSRDILKSMRRSLIHKGKLSGQELSVACQMYNEYKTSCEVI